LIFSVPSEILSPSTIRSTRNPHDRNRNFNARRSLTIAGGPQPVATRVIVNISGSAICSILSVTSTGHFVQLPKTEF
jgi:hypothetical protein